MSSYVRPYPSGADVILCSRSHLSLDRYRIPHALLIYPTHPFVHILVLVSPSSPLISLRSSHLIELTYPVRPKFFSFFIPHIHGLLCAYTRLRLQTDALVRKSKPIHVLLRAPCIVPRSAPSSHRIAFTWSLPCSLMLVYLYHPRSFVALALVSSHFALSYYDPTHLLILSITFLFTKFLRIVVYLPVVSLSFLLLFTGWLACKTLTGYPCSRKVT